MKRSLLALALTVASIGGVTALSSTPASAAVAQALPSSRTRTSNGCTVAIGYFTAYSGFAQQMSATGTCKRIRVLAMNVTCSIVSATAVANSPPRYKIVTAGLSVPIYYLWVEVTDKYGVVRDWTLAVTGAVS